MISHLLKVTFAFLVFTFLAFIIPSVVIADSEKSSRKEIKDAEYYYNLGVDCANSDKYQEAIDAFKQAIRIKPDYALAHYRLGCTYLILGDKDSVMEEYKILKRLDKEKANILFNKIYP